MTQTEEYIKILAGLKTGACGLLRAHAGQSLDRSVDGFDLFAGLWWPLRRKSPRAPRREIAWMIAKLYSACPLEHSPGHTLARQLRRCEPNQAEDRKRFRQRFDALLALPLDKIEPALQGAISRLAQNNKPLDWVQLVDDLSSWENETTRLRWAKQYLESDERR